MHTQKHTNLISIPLQITLLEVFKGPVVPPGVFEIKLWKHHKGPCIFLIDINSLLLKQMSLN